MTEPDSPFAPTVVKVLTVEFVVLLALWFLGRYFSS